MFDSPQPFKLCQVQRNQHKKESYLKNFIYSFFIKNAVRQIKYIANVKEYENGLMTIDFYPKIHAAEKYRILTNQNKFGEIGSTVLQIMGHIQAFTNAHTFGILSAALLTENEHEETKRFGVYIKILQRTMDAARFSVTGVKENSFIIITPIELQNQLNEIYLQYEHIFEETN